MGNIFMNKLRYFLITSLTLFAAACGSSPGLDAISSHESFNGLATGCTTPCHAAQSTISPDPIRTNGSGTAGKHGVHVSSRSITCTICHYDQINQPAHMNGTLDTGKPALPVVNINVAGIIGTWTNTIGPGTGNCSSVACHGPAVLDWYGIGGLPDCIVCHTGTLDPIATNGAGLSGKHSLHVGSSNIPCIKCHAAYPDAPGHMNAAFDTGNASLSLVSFDAANPSGTWTNDTGPQTGSCASLACHNNQTVDWYTTASWTMPPACSTCHGSIVGTRRQVLGAAGDFNKESHHVISYASRTSEIIVDNDCRVCHNMANHTSGTVRLAHKDNALVVIYQPANPASLESFCLSCHDSNGANGNMSPFTGGNTLGAGRNVAGNKIAGYWNSAFTTHKSRGLTCAGTGSPNTGCHGNNRSINMHGSSSRGLLSQNMTNPINPTAAYNYNDYRLCFDCHASYPAVTKEVVLGLRIGRNYDVILSLPPYPAFNLPATPYYTAGIQSQFRDQFTGSGKPYDDINALIPYTFMPLHNLHLLGSYQESPLIDPSPNWFTWNYRGDAARAGRITCIACHNVHGTNSPVRSTFDQLQLTRQTGVGADRSVSLPSSAATQSVIQSYPMNCSKDCHGIAGSTSYWYSPANE